MSTKANSHSAFVPHDIVTPIPGASHGPLAGLTVAIKDMYDIAGARTGGGSPDWLEAHPPAITTAGAVQSLLDAGAHGYRQDDLRRILLQRHRRKRSLRHTHQSARTRPLPRRVVEWLGGRHGGRGM